MVADDKPGVQFRLTRAAGSGVGAWRGYDNGDRAASWPNPPRKWREITILRPLGQLFSPVIFPFGGLVGPPVY